MENLTVKLFNEIAEKQLPGLALFENRTGSGKTTLLNCISTIDTISSGHIYLENQDITEIKEENIGRQYDIERKSKLLIEKLEDLLEQGDATAKKKICELIKAAKA